MSGSGHRLKHLLDEGTYEDKDQSLANEQKQSRNTGDKKKKKPRESERERENFRSAQPPTDAEAGHFESLQIVELPVTLRDDLLKVCRRDALPAERGRE